MATPNETAVRFRRDLPTARAAASRGEYAETLNYAEALVNAASCSTCVFYSKNLCKAQSPELVVIHSQYETAWPQVNADNWCGMWKAA